MPDIRHQISADASPEAAYRALTTPAGLQGWWSTDCDIGGAPGDVHELRFHKDGRTVVMQFRVDAMEPGRVAWTCTDNGNPIWPGTTLTWTLTPHGDGVHVAFEHRGFAEDRSPPFQMTRDGWVHFCASLKAYLENGRGQPWG